MYFLMYRRKYCHPNHSIGKLASYSSNITAISAEKHNIEVNLCFIASNFNVKLVKGVI